MRPARLVLVTGTGTAVGKTWLAARTLETLAATTTVAARKPVQSFEPGTGPTDAEVLATATADDPTRVCPAHRWYPRAMAPPMAAAALGEEAFRVRDLVGEVAWPDGVEVGVVEGVGGPRSPLAADGDTVDLARALEPDLVVLVAPAGLGTINLVRLAAAPFARIAPLVVVLNRFDPHDDLQRANADWLTERDGFEVISGADAPTRLAVRARGTLGAHRPTIGGSC